MCEPQLTLPARFPTLSHGDGVAEQGLLRLQTESLTHTREGGGGDTTGSLSQKRPENMSTDEGDTVKTPLCVPFGQETGNYFHCQVLIMQAT